MHAGVSRPACKVTYRIRPFKMFVAVFSVMLLHAGRREGVCPYQPPWSMCCQLTKGVSYNGQYPHLGCAKSGFNSSLSPTSLAAWCNGEHA